MTHPILALQATLAAALRADPDLPVFDAPPAGRTPPYVTIARHDVLPRDGEPQAGQVALFRLGRTAAPKHCGVMVAGNRFIHAQEGLGVVEANLTEGWARRVAGLYEFPGVTN